MVNIVIYLNQEHDPKKLIEYLIAEKLIASATIKENKLSYRLADEGFSGVVYNIITAQSKSLLFDSFVNSVESKIGHKTPIFSTPVVSFNTDIDDTINKSNLKNS